MKILAKATRYMELSRQSKKLTAPEKKEHSALRGELASCGLDPKHQKGLVQRAIVFDNKKTVRAFIKDASNPRSTRHHLEVWADTLRKLGIENVKAKSLQTILNSFETNADATDRLKHRKKTRPPHRSAQPEEIYYDDADDKINEEDDVDAVPTEATAF